MGVVYKAEDLNLHRIAALKFLPPGAADSDEILPRFQQETEAISALNHPAIATIYGLEEGDGLKFLALEFIPGGTLKSRIRQLALEGKQMPIAEVTGIAAQIAEGLGHAHAHHIVHRDIKSDNVMLSGEGNAKITDFGLAKVRGSASLTRTGSTVGTLAYISPEQLRGEEAGVQSDIFSFGVVLYEMASGKLPFRGEHEAALTYSIAHEDPVNLKTVRPDLPPGLEQVIMTCLRKEPSERYRDAREIVADLRNACGPAFAVHGRSGEAPLKTPSTVRTGGNNRRWIAGAAAVALLAVIAYFFFSSGHAHSSNAKTVAVLPFTNMSGSADDDYFSDGMTEDIPTQLAKIRDLKVLSRTSVMPYKGTKKSGKEIGEALHAGVLLEGTVRRSGNQVRITAQLIDAATDENIWGESYDKEDSQIFAVQSEIARNIAASLKATLAPGEKERLETPAVSKPEVYNLLLQGRYLVDRTDRSSVGRAIEIFGHALAIDSTDARVWAALAYTYTIQADFGYVQLAEGYERAKAAALKATAFDDKLADGHAALAAVLKNYVWDWDGAGREYDKAMSLEPGNPVTISQRASLAGALGKFDEAISWDQKAIDRDPVRATSYWYLALFQMRSKRLPESVGTIKKLIELNPDYPEGHGLLAVVYLLLGNRDSAAAELGREPEEDFRTNALAMLRFAQGRKEESEAYAREYISNFQDIGAFQVVEIFGFMGDADRTIAWLETSYKNRDGGITLMKGDPCLTRIEHDPRYIAFLKNHNIPAE